MSSDGSAKKPHCARGPAPQGMTWDLLRRCACALCVAAGCGGGSLVESDHRAHSSCLMQSREEGTSLLSFPQIRRCWLGAGRRRPEAPFRDGFDLQHKVLEVRGGSQQWCVLPKGQTLTDETSMPEYNTQLALADGDSAVGPLCECVGHPSPKHSTFIGQPSPRRKQRSFQYPSNLIKPSPSARWDHSH